MEIEAVSKKIDGHFRLKNEAREKALVYSRKVIKDCGIAIRAIHRGQIGQAEKLLKEAREALDTCEELLQKHLDIFYAGFVQNAQKEYAEAVITYSLILNKTLPSPEVLRVGYAQYANGLGEAIGELRRHILDLIRKGEAEKGEKLLQIMDDIFYLLFSFDYPEAVTYGLRRLTDVARAVMERTRGDLTTALEQKELREVLAESQKRFKKGRKRR